MVNNGVLEIRADQGGGNTKDLTPVKLLGKSMEQESRLNPLPSLNKEEMAAFESALAEADGVEEIADLLKSKLKIEDDHVAFLIQQGGAAKLREFYYEVIKFDLNYGTNTSSYIPESFYVRIAKENPESLANPSHAVHGVKHRSSLTSTIVTGFNTAVTILRNHGFNPSEASLFDMGCGEGKAILIGMSNGGHFRTGDSGEKDYRFKKGVGVDYYEDVLAVAQKNVQSKELSVNGKREVRFEFADAAEYRGFNGLNVVYMYNPFNQEIMRKVEKNLRKYAGKSIVIYNKPLHHDLFDNKGWKLERDIADSDPDKQTRVYSWGLDAPNAKLA